MDVVSLLLAVYPTTILALEQYKKGAKYIHNWRHFYRQYQHFILDIGNQQFLFENILEDLMCGGSDPFLPPCDSKNAFLQIVKSSSYQGWRDPGLEEKLNARLDNGYQRCISTIQRIYDIFVDLGNTLDIQTVRLFLVSLHL
jgi:hypothetical protein